MSNIILIGIDEAGRGPLAGPVAVGVFAFLHNKAQGLFQGVKDSKQLSEKKREEWFAKIQKAKEDGLVDFSVILKSQRVVDSQGISYAIKEAIKEGLNAIKANAHNSEILLDGGLLAPSDYKQQKTIIKGDEKEIVIALSSICAKVTRDRYMVEISGNFPEYGFHIHKGYGTKRHIEAIKRYGTCTLHRLTFLHL